MKRKIIAIILAAALAVALAGCANPAEFAETEEQTGPRDTPQRIGTKGIIHSSLHLTWETWEEILGGFEFVADITITGWLGEVNTRNSSITLFSANVNRVFKGELPNEIRISQGGSGEFTHDGFPLFQKDNRMLVLLNEINDPERVADFHIGRYMEQCETEEIQYDDKHVNHINNLFIETYYSFSKTHNLFHFDIEEFNDEMYLINRGGAVLEYLHNGRSEAMPLNSENARLSSDVIERLYENDPLLRDNSWREKYVFEYNDFTDEIVRFSLF
jgi:hypothetical protein